MVHINCPDAADWGRAMVENFPSRSIRSIAICVIPWAFHLIGTVLFGTNDSLPFGGLTKKLDNLATSNGV